jgi:hypothetical protein
MLAFTTLLLSLLAPSSLAMTCDLVPPITANELLGARGGLPQLTGPEQDEETPGAMRSVCMYMAGKRMLLVIEHTFKDAKAARDATTQEAIRARHEDDGGATIKDEPGLGDKAYWIVLKNGGGEYVVIKGAKVLSIVLGGVAKSPAEFQAQLKAATTAALAKF